MPMLCSTKVRLTRLSGISILWTIGCSQVCGRQKGRKTRSTDRTGATRGGNDEQDAAPSHCSLSWLPLQGNEEETCGNSFG